MIREIFSVIWDTAQKLTSLFIGVHQAFRSFKKLGHICSILMKIDLRKMDVYQLAQQVEIIFYALHICMATYCLNTFSSCYIEFAVNYCTCMP